MSSRALRKLQKQREAEQERLKAQNAEGDTGSEDDEELPSPQGLKLNPFAMLNAQNMEDAE